MTTVTVTTASTGPVEITLAEQGEGRPVLLLHGGAGTLSVAGYAARLAAAKPVRVLTPTHPGFDGTPRPDSLSTVAGLADVYVALLEELDLDDVLVVGNSIGGWITAEIGVRRSSRVTALAVVDGVGIQVPGHPVADFFSLTLPQVADLSYYEPDKFRIDPAALPPEVQANLAGNRTSLSVYAGPAMADPTLRTRLAGIDVPTLVLWGESDRIADPGYGSAYAASIPGATFEVLPRTGHLPQVETPARFTDALWSFVGTAHSH